MKKASQRLEASVAQFDDRALAEPTEFPGWTRGHVVAHLTHNADAFFEMTGAAFEGPYVGVGWPISMVRVRPLHQGTSTREKRF